jgi:hypothetical protein
MTTQRPRGWVVLPLMCVVSLVLGITNIAFGNVLWPGIPNLLMAVFFGWGAWVQRK